MKRYEEIKSRCKSLLTIRDKNRSTNIESPVLIQCMISSWHQVVPNHHFLLYQILFSFLTFSWLDFWRMMYQYCCLIAYIRLKEFQRDNMELSNAKGKRSPLDECQFTDRVYEVIARLVIEVWLLLLLRHSRALYRLMLLIQNLRIVESRNSAI